MPDLEPCGTSLLTARPAWPPHSWSCLAHVLLSGGFSLTSAGHFVRHICTTRSTRTSNESSPVVLSPGPRTSQIGSFHSRCAAAALLLAVELRGRFAGLLLPALLSARCFASAAARLADTCCTCAVLDACPPCAWMARSFTLSAALIADRECCPPPVRLAAFGMMPRVFSPTCAQRPAPDRTHTVGTLPTNRAWNCQARGTAYARTCVTLARSWCVVRPPSRTKTL